MSVKAPKLTIRQHNENNELVARLISCLPAATFEMETLCRLAGIKVSRTIPSAAVECTFRPHLLLNPDFVAKYCARDEHLFLLVMHELWHVILAHTRLYPRATLAHNIAFDAIINSGLARQFSAPEFRGFFEAINQSDAFPECLLRPPEGWPSNPLYPVDQPPGTRQIVERLYPVDNKGRWSAPLYEEILNLLRDWIKEKIANGELILEPVLIGDHSGGDSRALDDSVMRDILRRVTESWPAPMFATGSRGSGTHPSDLFSSIDPTTEAARRMFSRVLQVCLAPVYGRQSRRARSLMPGMNGMHVLPNPRDRMASARERLGVQGVLWGQPGMIMARQIETPSRAYVYLDVSGSMNQLLPHLLGLLLPYALKGSILVYQFSTIVEPLPCAQLRRAQLRTTQGTDINCVLPHLLAETPPVRRVLIVTDGFTGVPHPDYARQLQERNIRVHVVLLADNSSAENLRGIARSITILPSSRKR